MKNIAEELIAKVSGKFFFSKHVYKNVLFMENNGEHEVCDVLIEFADCYVCIQSKEKDDAGVSIAHKWFDNKVKGGAKKQAKLSIEAFKTAGTNFYIYSEKHEKQPVIIDTQKLFLPIIVFYNVNYDSYNRHVYSQKLNMPINIFSYEDFCTMLNTIILPYDIVEYILQRNVYMPDCGGKRFIIEDVSEEYTLMYKPKSEKEYAELYLVKNYFQKNIRPENISFYNEFLLKLNDDYQGRHSVLFDMLLMADINTANRIVNNHVNILENLTSEDINTPLFIFVETTGIMFFRKPFGMADSNFNDYLSSFGLYFAYKHHLTKIYALIFMHLQDDQFTINIGEQNYTLPEYDEKLEQLMKDLPKSWKK